MTDLEAAIESEMADGNIPGIGAAVLRGGKVVWAEGFGWADHEAGREVTPDTPFFLASISKTVIAVALMQTRDEGLVDLSDPVNDHLPFNVDNPQVDNEEIGLVHLATHTSGIKDNWDVMDPLYVFGRDSPISLGSFMEGYLVAGGAYYDADKNFRGTEPGEKFRYSNVAASLAAYSIETRRGEGFDDYCDRAIFAVLGMDNTHWHLADFEEDVIAVPYGLRGGEWQAIEHFSYPDYPDGQLRSSVNDLSRFLATIASGGTLDGVTLLDSDSVDEMLIEQLPGIKSGQGIFWATYEMGGRTLTGHDGGDPGVTTEMGFDTDTGNGFVLLMNYEWTSTSSRAFKAMEEALMDAAETTPPG